MPKSFREVEFGERTSACRLGAHGTDNNGAVHRALRRLSIICALAVLAAGCGDGGSKAAPALVLPSNAAPSTLYDAKGRPITVLQDENRTSIPLDQIPSLLQNAVISVEDERFWIHKGIDPEAIARAANVNADSGSSTEGGSTITQQYVKTVLLTPEKSLSRKIEEAALALEVERNYSKRLILELYLNTVYFGNGAYGIDAAARSYFGVAPKDLSVAQAALLAGIIQAPSKYDPRVRPDLALQRRDLVLRRMKDQGYITAEQAAAAKATPVELVAPTPPPEAQRYAAPHFVDEVKRWLLKESTALGATQTERFNNLYGGGLKITTTVDLDTQAQAEQSIAEVLKNQGSDPKTPDAGLVAIEPQTGFVRAMVGGYDYFGTHDYRQTNLATGAGRQTGSSFKPIVLATALSNGITPETTFAGTTVHKIPGEKPWVPQGRGGTVTDCTIRSDNACYGNMILDPRVGPAKAVEMAKRLGMVHTKLDAYPSAVLGTNRSTVEDMASVYATFADNGMHVPPAIVTKIERSDGTVLYEHQHTQTKALEPTVVQQISSILPGVIAAGTGTKANIGRLAAGKTGTTDNNVDAWFCGYTHELASAVWVGFAQLRDRRLVQMEPPNTRITVQGGTYPAEIWSRFMSKAMTGLPDLPLWDPANTPPPTTTVPASNAASIQPIAAPKSVKMPDLSGLTGEAALAKVSAAGLAGQVVDSTVEGVAPGSVTAQSPAAGTTLPTGTTVYVEVVPAPPTTTTAPPGLADVRGFGANQAKAQLEAAGYVVTLQPVAPPPGTVSRTGRAYAAGQVWQTTPPAGQMPADNLVTVAFVPASAGG